MKGKQKLAARPCRSVIARMILTTRRHFGIGGVRVDFAAASKVVLPRLGTAARRARAASVAKGSLALLRPDRFECLVQASTDSVAGSVDPGWRVQRARASRSH